MSSETMKSIIFEDASALEKFRLLQGADATTSEEEMVEVYLKGSGEYVNRAKEYRRSQTTKHAWRKKAHVFKAGIKKYHRSGKAMRARVTLGTRLSSTIKKKDEGFCLHFREYEMYEFLKSISSVKASVYREATVFKLEESYADFAIFAEEVNTSLNRIEEAILTSSVISCKDMEHLLMLVECEVFDEEGRDEDGDLILEENETYVDRLLSLIGDTNVTDMENTREPST